MNTQFCIPVHCTLAAYATLIWEVNGPAVQETILPQGVVEIVFHFADAIQGIPPHQEDPVRTPRCFVQGFNTHVIRATYIGRQHLVGVRLQPHRVRGLLGVPPSAFLNATVDLSLLHPRFDTLWHQLGEAASFEERVGILLRELPVLDPATCPRSDQLSKLVLGPGADAFESVDALARAVCYSTKQLGRVSRQLFGISAEMLVTYKKFLEAVKGVHRPHASLTSVGYDSGFYDQAHFSRVFKSFSGMTPKEYRAGKSAVPFHLFPGPGATCPIGTIRGGLATGALHHGTNHDFVKL
ncbi:AraC family transcriptional regulator [Flaviaesturariibacter flavus]|uniref:AraC family transcriptional regulator n=1 Tax=Flaviaesturariibacter flavus TaxID=2502780 RepID=A0A4R1B3V1_9BACT|nr:helix-turn-helix domain-containing protein [Flaviaesturariibacter flavus]TCJ12571.1 AraC family transcriptional regulator [Flaviaesturariibacter flavus]